MTITVAHIRDYIRDGSGVTPCVLPERVVYIGRANKRYGLAESPLANLFVIGGIRWRIQVVIDNPNHPDSGRGITWHCFTHGGGLTRKQSIQMYQSMLVECAKDGAPSICAELTRLLSLARSGDLVLACWCAPKPCHGDVVKAWLEKALEEAE